MCCIYIGFKIKFNQFRQSNTGHATHRNIDMKFLFFAGSNFQNLSLNLSDQSLFVCLGSVKQINPISNSFNCLATDRSFCIFFYFPVDRVIIGPCVTMAATACPHNAPLSKCQTGIIKHSKYLMTM